MAYRIKYGIGTAVSIGLLIGKHPVTGIDVEQEEIFLPGAVLPVNTVPRITEGVDKGEDHISKLVEKIDGRSGEAVEPEPGEGDGSTAEPDNPFVPSGDEPGKKSSRAAKGNA